MAKIFVGMSGGVDSSVAAYLLTQEGHEVTGVTFTALTEQGSKKCCSLEEIESARTVCRHLGIAHQVADLKDLFEARVIQYFISAYRRGLTPNPCAMCNRFIKFGALVELALSQGADYFATGHYVRTGQANGETLIRRASDKVKDQSYFLSLIPSESLPRLRFPLGDLDKSKVRALAQEAGLPINPHKSESQDICFIKDDFRDFLRDRGVPETPGDFVYQEHPVGRHKGFAYYSYGQRRGHGVALGQRVFIRRFIAENNTIELGEIPLSRKFTVRSLIRHSAHFDEGTYDIQCRYQSRAVPGTVRFDGEQARVELDTAQPIVTPGQIAAFYRDNYILGAGIIEKMELE